MLAASLFRLVKDRDSTSHMSTSSRTVSSGQGDIQQRNEVVCTKYKVVDERATFVDENYVFLGWRDDPMVKNLYFSFQKTEFSSQYLHEEVHNHL